jgi:hypothetical protein
MVKNNCRCQIFPCPAARPTLDQPQIGNPSATCAPSSPDDPATGTLRLRHVPELFRRFWPSHAPSNGSVALLLGRLLRLQRRSGDASTPLYWLGGGLGLANHWRFSPLSIRSASGVHIGNLAICWRGSSLKLLWRFGDSGARLLIQSLPAIFFLAGDDEDLRAGARLAKLGLVEAGNLAQAANRTRPR